MAAVTVQMGKEFKKKQVGFLFIWIGAMEPPSIGGLVLDEEADFACSPTCHIRKATFQHLRPASHQDAFAKAQPAAGHPASVYRATYNIINGGEMRGPRHIFDGFDGRDYR
eukprot:1158337-Pelagomonas_calceolata.AAC.4